MAKKNEPIKCAKCNLEFPDTVLSEKRKNKAFVRDHTVLCKDCLVMLGASPAFMGFPLVKDNQTS